MKKHIKFSLLILAILVLAGCGNASVNDAGNSETVKNTYTKITAKEAIKMMEEESDYIILDVRRPDEFADQHIPNAINVPNENIGIEEIPELPNKEQLILVYCRSGNRSKQASEKLVKLGYTNIYEFGGINSWPGETVRE